MAGRCSLLGWLQLSLPSAASGREARCLSPHVFLGPVWGGEGQVGSQTPASCLHWSGLLRGQAQWGKARSRIGGQGQSPSSFPTHTSCCEKGPGPASWGRGFPERDGQLGRA